MLYFYVVPQERSKVPFHGATRWTESADVDTTFKLQGTPAKAGRTSAQLQNKRSIPETAMDRTTCQTIVCADMLLPSSQGETIPDAAVAVHDGHVLACGPRAEIMAAHHAGQVEELGNSLLMPGLVNTHTHAPMTYLRGLADDLPLLTWLNEHIFPVEKNLTEDIVTMGALLGCAEMMASGTTTFCDMYLLEKGVARAVDRSGMRAVMGEVQFMFPTPGLRFGGRVL